MHPGKGDAADAAVFSWVKDTNKLYNTLTEHFEKPDVRAAALELTSLGYTAVSTAADLHRDQVSGEQLHVIASDQPLQSFMNIGGPTPNGVPDGGQLRHIDMAKRIDMATGATFGLEKLVYTTISYLRVSNGSGMLQIDVSLNSPLSTWMNVPVRDGTIVVLGPGVPHRVRRPLRGLPCCLPLSLALSCPSFCLVDEKRESVCEHPPRVARARWWSATPTLCLTHFVCRTEYSGHFRTSGGRPRSRPTAGHRGIAGTLSAAANKQEPRSGRRESARARRISCKPRAGG